MADLLTRPLLRRDEPAWGSRVPWLAAIGAAAWSLLAGYSMSVLPGVAVWIGEGATGPMSDPLRFGARVWLAAHRVGLDVAGSDFTFAPLGLTLVFVLLMHRSARWAAHSAGVGSTRGVVMITAPAVLTYALGGGALAGMATTADVVAVPLEAVVWAGGWSVVAVVVGVTHEAGLLAVWVDRVPVYARAVLAGAAAAVAGLVCTGAVLVTICAVMNSGRIGALAEALDAGVLGVTVLAVGCGLIVPNTVVWAASFALGPGFAMGTGTAVAPGGVELGVVPAVPVLGALPTSTPGAVTWVVVAGPVLTGTLAALVACRRLERDGVGRPHWLRASGVLAVAAVTAGAAMAVLALLSGGSAGAARLTEIGPVPWQTAAMCTAAVLVGGAVTIGVLQIRLERGDPASGGDGGGADGAGGDGAGGDGASASTLDDAAVSGRTVTGEDADAGNSSEEDADGGSARDDARHDARHDARDDARDEPGTTTDDGGGERTR